MEADGRTVWHSAASFLLFLACSRTGPVRRWLQSKMAAAYIPRGFGAAESAVGGTASAWAGVGPLAGLLCADRDVAASR